MPHTDPDDPVAKGPHPGGPRRTTREENERELRRLKAEVEALRVEAEARRLEAEAGSGAAR